MKKVWIFTVTIIVAVGLVLFYRSWYSYEIRSMGQSVPEPASSQTPSEDKIFVEQFDPNGTDSAKSTFVLKGSYPIEGDSGNRYAWVKQESKILINNMNGKSIVIKGFVPVSSLKKTNGSNEISIDFTINGQNIQKATFAEDQLFEQTIPFDSVTNIIKNNECELGIKVSNQFVPAKAGLGSDSRELSLMIKYIGLK